MPKPVIALVRVSTAGQAGNDHASIPAQRQICQRIAQQYDLHIVRWLELVDVSGTMVLQTEEMQSLLQALQRGEVQGVVCREFSRLMRPENFADFALLQAFADSSALLYLPDGPIDFASKTGHLLGGIRALLAGHERSEMLERANAAKEVKRRRGELAQSHIVLPFAVGYENGRWYYKPESVRVLQAYEQVLAGRVNYVKLAELIGVTPRGARLVLGNTIWKGWRTITQRRDPSAAGKYVGKDGRQCDRRKVQRPPEDVIEVQVISEPLISAEQWQRAQNVMQRKAAQHWRARPNYTHRFVYRGFLTCGQCGAPIHTAFQRNDVYVCRNRRLRHTCSSPYVKREVLEPVLDELIGRRVTDPGFIRTCVQSLQAGSASATAATLRRRLGHQLEALEAQRARVLDTYIAGHMGAPERDRRLAGVNRELAAVQGQLQEVQPVPGVDVNALAAQLTVLSVWPRLQPVEKRELLAKLLPQIKVASGRPVAVGIALSAGSRKATPCPVDFSMTAAASATAPQP